MLLFSLTSAASPNGDGGVCVREGTVPSVSLTAPPIPAVGPTFPTGGLFIDEACITVADPSSDSNPNVNTNAGCTGLLRMFAAMTFAFDIASGLQLRFVFVLYHPRSSSER
jgi:hypothetical protein